MHTALAFDEIGLVGCNHRSLAVEGREQLARWKADAEQWLSGLVNHGRIREGAILSTCNRFEVVLAGSGSLAVVRDQIVERVPESAVYAYSGREAVRHLYRVASSLDSMVLGEAQILGQVKASYTRAQELGTVSKYLHHLFQEAFSTAKRVRTHTGVAERGVSVSYVAVQMARQMFGDLRESSALVIGSGETAELVALHLGASGCSRMFIANRTLARAAELADRVGGTAVGLEAIPELLKSVDVVVGSILIDRPILETRMVREIRRVRPLFLVDLGVPRNFSAGLRDIPGVYLADVDELARTAEVNQAIRSEAAKDAEVVVDYGVHRYERWLQRLATEPHILSLRETVRTLVSQELERAVSGVATPDIELCVHRLTERITHEFGSRLAELGSESLPGSGSGSPD
jgi:glutamyl-tRNA reductase